MRTFSSFFVAVLLVFVSVPLAQARTLTMSYRGRSTATVTKTSRRSLRTIPVSSITRPITVAPSIPSLTSRTAASLTYDSNPNHEARSAILQLGAVTPALGRARILNTLEPFQVSTISVTFVAPPQSIDQVLLYVDDDGRFLGTTIRDSANPSRYVLTLLSGDLTVPKQQEVKIYARARLKSSDSGGISGESVQVASFTIEGTGGWSTDTYRQSTTETYQAFQTAQSVFTTVSNAGPATDTLVPGIERTIGAFRFHGVTSDGNAEMRLVRLDFTLSASSTVTVSNPRIRLGSISSDCSIAGTTLSCPFASSTMGSLPPAGATYTLSGDITLAPDARSAVLQTSLPMGSPSTLGGVTWTDGTTTYQWLESDSSTVNSTQYRY